ncbi:hypothetical protein BGW80DRAFT_1296329 [Lactifluus volemus]|nr:hypothetical protein BGW80DRAFT_1296329 [Lactifluus volemus]
MSLITKQDRISVRQFAAVPSLVGLPEITRSARSLSTSIELEEGCMVTKLVKYTHRVVYFVKNACDGDPGDVENIIKDLAIVPFTNFTLDKPCNLAFLESYIHTSLDVYAFIAITPSLSTLDNLIQMVKSDNDYRQSEMDEIGRLYPRKLDFTAPCYVDPEYELVALHPEHFLPNGSSLLVCDPVTQGHKLYVVAQDRCLRESTDPNSNPFPPFHHRAKARGRDLHPNVFLVALNAEMKFRRYLKMVRANAPPAPLPDHVLALMHRTIELVDLLYWWPISTKGSSGSEEQRMDKDKDSQIPPDSWARSRLKRHELRPTSIWPEDMDLEARKARGMALMSGHDPAFYDSDDAYGMMDDTDNPLTSWK